MTFLVSISQSKYGNRAIFPDFPLFSSSIRAQLLHFNVQKNISQQLQQ